MPLSVGKPILVESIKAAYNNAKSNGAEGKMDADAVINTLATEIAEAVHAYVMSASVTTMVAGTALGPPAPTNPVSAVVTAMGTGSLS